MLPLSFRCSVFRVLLSPVSESLPTISTNAMGYQEGINVLMKVLMKGLHGKISGFARNSGISFGKVVT